MNKKPTELEEQTSQQDAEVKKLCERLGYGFVMESASRQWREKDPVGAFTVGPCAGVTNFDQALASLKGERDET